LPAEIDDIVVNIAARTTRSLEDTQRNPIVAVETVRDLVAYYQYQPRLA
jgi:hypothetical protein